MIGCSFLAGDGVSLEDNFVSRLERARPDLLCHNYSLSGSGNCQQLLFHNHFAPMIDPEVLVLAPYTGCAKRTVIRERPTYDPLANRKVARPNPFCLLDDQDRLHLGNQPVPRVTDYLAEKPRPAPRLFEHPPGSTLKRRSPAESRFSPPAPPLDGVPKAPSFDIYANPDGDHYKIVRRVLRTTIECSNASRRILMPLPHLNNLLHPEQEYRHLYEEVAAETGCEFHDLMPDFAAWSGTGFAPLFLSGNGHYAPAGHRVIAQSLTKLL